jgi:hypothetical protein
LEQVWGKVQDMDKLRTSYLKNAINHYQVSDWDDNDYKFLAEDIKKDVDWVKNQVARL